MSVPPPLTTAPSQNTMTSWSGTERPEPTGSSSVHGYVLICEQEIFYFIEWESLLKWFPLQYHHSFIAVDPCLGPLVLSVCLEDEEKRLRVILRCSFLMCTSPVSCELHSSCLFVSCHWHHWMCLKLLPVLPGRLRESSLHGLFSVSLFSAIPSAVELAKVSQHPLSKIKSSIKLR